MGKFIDHADKQVVNNYIDSYMDSIIDYSKFQKGTPTYVTYYSKDFHASTADKGLGEVVENIGSESPLKFNKILNFPLYSAEEMIPDLTYDEELGLDTDLNSSAIFLPDTIEPQIGDYFSISYEDIEKLYKVNDVQVTAHSDKIFYKITFASVSSSLDILEERQIQDIYEVVFENIGTEKNSIILKRDYIVLDCIRKTYDKIVNRYEKVFFNRKLNQFVYYDSENNAYQYDNNLAIFINNNRMFINEKTLLENIIIEPILTSYEDEENYENSLYNAIEQNDKSLFKNKTYILETFNKGIFKVYSEKYLNILYFPINETDTNSSNIWLNTFLDYDLTNLDEILTKEKFNYDEIINIFLNEFNNTKITYQNLNDMIETIEIKRDYKNYILVPILIYILLKIEYKIFTT